MLGRIFRARSPGERPALDPPSRPAVASLPWTAAAAPPAGIILYLCALGLVGAATVGVFFGIGLVMLMHHPAAPADRQTAAATAARLSAATTRLPEPPAAKAPPASATEPASLLRKTGAAPLPAQPMPLSKPPAVADAPAPVPSASPDGSEAHAAPAAPTAAAPDAAISEPAATAPAVPPPAASPHLSTEEVAALLARGDALFRRGHPAAARLLYRRALDAGEGRGALGMGATYDPSFLNRGRRHGSSGDPAVAGFWYRQALVLGAPEAEGRLATLAGGPPR